MCLVGTLRFLFVSEMEILGWMMLLTVLRLRVRVVSGDGGYVENI
jgi:hypothetical protein